MRILLIALLTAFAGCAETGVAPVERVIDAPSANDFGFVGEWKQTGDDVSSHADVVISISRENETTYSVSGFGTEYEQFTVRFSATEIAPDKPHAIVELTVSDPSGMETRRLVYASVRDDRLRVWLVNARALGDLLYARRAPAVIEHDLSSTTVRCDGPLLLDTIRTHPKELLGELRTFRRVAE